MLSLMDPQPESRPRPRGGNLPLKECRRLRMRAYDLAAQAVGKDFVDFVNAWVELSERQRIISGKPLPGVRKPDDSPTPRRHSRPTAVPLEPVAIEHVAEPHPSSDTPCSAPITETGFAGPITQPNASGHGVDPATGLPLPVGV